MVCSSYYTVMYFLWKCSWIACYIKNVTLGCSVLRSIQKVHVIFQALQSTFSFRLVLVQSRGRFDLSLKVLSFLFCVNVLMCTLGQATLPSTLKSQLLGADCCTLRAVSNGTLLITSYQKAFLKQHVFSSMEVWLTSAVFTWFPGFPLNPLLKSADKFI